MASSTLRAARRQVAGGIVDQSVRARLLALERLHRIVGTHRVHGNAHEGVNYTCLRHAEDLEADDRLVGNVHIPRRDCIGAR